MGLRDMVRIKTPKGEQTRRVVMHRLSPVGPVIVNVVGFGYDVSVVLDAGRSQESVLRTRWAIASSLTAGSIPPSAKSIPTPDIYLFNYNLRLDIRMRGLSLGVAHSVRYPAVYLGEDHVRGLFVGPSGVNLAEYDLNTFKLEAEAPAQSHLESAEAVLAWLGLSTAPALEKVGLCGLTLARIESF
jgi:hypothetical protein